ncbi:MAG: hypothetical protein QW175_01690 [Candidatus Bathyarchaeia archaeon]
MDPTLQFIIFAGLAIFFTGLAWNRQKPVPCFLSAFIWIAFSLVNMMEASSLPLSQSLSWLCLGIGLILLLRGVWLILDMWRRS